MPAKPPTQTEQNGQVGAGAGYSLRRAINTTPHAHHSVINSASCQAMRSPSPSARSGHPGHPPNPNKLPFVNQPLSQPQFNIPQHPSDEDTIVFAPTRNSNNSTQQAIGGSFLTGPCSYNLVDYFRPNINEEEMQSFCVDANIEMTPSPPPDQPILNGNSANSLPAAGLPAVIPNRFPVAAPLSAQEQAQSDKKRQAFLLTNSFTSLATNLSKVSGALANTNFPGPTLIPNRFPPVHPLSDKEKAHSDQKCLDYLATLGFTTQPEERKASTSGTSAEDDDAQVDYNLSAEDENDL